MSLSTHVLDTALGKPAAGVALTLWQFFGDTWQEIGHGTTDADGRCKTLLGGRALEVATYRIRFATGSYYAAQQTAGLYPYVEIVFNVRSSEQHYHIPLLLTANSYTTYRGS